MSRPIYLDNQATTPIDPRVLEAMLPFLKEDFGNAASRSHAFGWRAEAAVETARKQVAQLLGAQESEIVFTSGATESNNLAIKGALDFYREKGAGLVTVATEHKSVLDPCRRLERQRKERHEELSKAGLQGEPLERLCGGASLTVLGVDSQGLVRLPELEAALDERTVLVSVMLANNEIGVLQPVEAIGRLCRQEGVLFHSDLAQAAGKVAFDVEKSSVDLASLSAHKLYGPKGVGALYVRKKPRVRLLPLFDGGGHERGLRSGTLNVAGIVGFGKAAELARQELEAEAARTLALRERLREGLCAALSGVSVNGSLDQRLPGNLNVSFEGVEGDALMIAVRQLAMSSGSACTSAALEPSYVLRALGVSAEAARGSLRFGVGRFTTEEEIDTAVRLLVEKVKALRELSAAAR